MGLDMYAYATDHHPPTPVGFTLPDGVKPSLLHQWRKHPNLHGWMEKLYREKGGTADEFNVVPVQLTAEDLDALETAIKEKSLPQTSGFFFGRSEGDEMEDDLNFIAKARAAIAEGKAIIYDSWW